MKNLIQIAGVQSLTEAKMLFSEGVDWVGLPLRLEVHAPDVSEDEAGAIIRECGRAERCVLITYLERADAVVAFCRTLGVKKVQLHGDISLNELRELRLLWPELFVIKSLVVRKNNHEELFESCEELAPFVDAFITDTFDPETGASGATGKTHDWEVSREIVKVSPKPVLLAGGLNPHNVCEAIRFVRPAAVDAHTGVEDRHGRKDPALVRGFVDEARIGFDN